MSKITWDNRENSGSKSNLNAVIFNETKESTNALYDIIEAQLGTTSSVSSTNLTTSGNLLISGNLIPNTPSNNNTSSFTLGGENNVWEEIFIGPTTIKYVDSEGNTTSLSKDDVVGMKGGKFPVPPKTVNEETFNNWEDLEIIFSKEDLYKNINLSEENEIKFVFRNNPFGQGNLNDSFIHIDDNEHSIHIGSRESSTTTYLYDNIELRNSGSFIISGTLGMFGRRGFPPPTLPGVYEGYMRADINDDLRIIKSNREPYGQFQAQADYTFWRSDKLPYELTSTFEKQIFFVDSQDPTSYQYNLRPHIFNNPPTSSRKAFYDNGTGIGVLEEAPFNAGYTATCSFSIPFSASEALNQVVTIGVRYKPLAFSTDFIKDPNAIRNFVLRPENFPNGIVTGSFESEIRVAEPLHFPNVATPDDIKIVDEEGQPYIKYLDLPVPILRSPSNPLLNGTVQLDISSTGYADAWYGYIPPVQINSSGYNEDPIPFNPDPYRIWESYIHPTWNMTPNDISTPGYTSPHKAYSYTLSLGFPYPRVFWAWSDNLVNLQQPLLDDTIDGTYIFLNNGIIEKNHTSDYDAGSIGGEELDMDIYNIFRVDNNDFYIKSSDNRTALNDIFDISLPTSSSNPFLYKSYDWSFDAYSLFKGGANVVGIDVTDVNTFPWSYDNLTNGVTISGNGEDSTFHREYVVPTNVTRYATNHFLGEGGYLANNTQFPPYYAIPGTGSTEYTPFTVSDTIHAPEQDIELVVFKAPTDAAYEIQADIDLVAWATTPKEWTNVLGQSIGSYYYPFNNMKDTFTFKVKKQSIDGTITTLASKGVTKKRRTDYTPATEYRNAIPTPYFAGGIAEIYDDTYQRNSPFSSVNILESPTINPEWVAYEEYLEENQITWLQNFHCGFYNSGPARAATENPLLVMTQFVWAVIGSTPYLSNGEIELTQTGNSISNQAQANFEIDNYQVQVVQVDGTSTYTVNTNWIQGATEQVVYDDFGNLIGSTGGTWEEIVTVTLDTAQVTTSPNSHWSDIIPDFSLDFALQVGNGYYIEGTEHIQGPFIDQGGNQYYEWCWEQWKDADAAAVGERYSYSEWVIPEYNINYIQPSTQWANNALAASGFINGALTLGTAYFPPLFLIWLFNPLGWFEPTGLPDGCNCATISYPPELRAILGCLAPNPHPKYLSYDLEKGDIVFATVSVHNGEFCMKDTQNVYGKGTALRRVDEADIRYLGFTNNTKLNIKSYQQYINSPVHITFNTGSNDANLEIKNEYYPGLSPLGCHEVTAQVKIHEGGCTIANGGVLNIGTFFHPTDITEFEGPLGNYIECETDNSMLVGQSLVTSGDGTFNLGKNNKIIGNNSITAGQGNYSINGNNQTLLGLQNTIYSGSSNFVHGQLSEISASISHVQGTGNISKAIGAHVEGTGSKAEGKYSHAEGDSDSFGAFSHSEGHKTSTYGRFSHAEGNFASAAGFASHVEGANTTAPGTGSHAEGQRNYARASYSHTEGLLTDARGVGSHAEGYNTNTSNARISSAGVFSHAEGNGTLTIGKASHAEGKFTTSSGNYSHAEGFLSVAGRRASHAEGNSTSASAAYSHTEGILTKTYGHHSHAEGAASRTYGEGAHAEGEFTLASGSYSHAEGKGTIAQKDYSHAEGINTRTSGSFGAYSHVEGYYSLASAQNAHAEGYSSDATGFMSHAEGKNTIASAFYSHAEGSGSKADGNSSHAEGKKTEALAVRSHTEGVFTKATGVESHAEGHHNITVGYGSHAEGLRNTSSAEYSHTEGEKTKTFGGHSHAEGYLTITVAGADYSHAEGYQSSTKGDYSHAEGWLTTASANYSHAEGKNTSTISQVGGHAQGDNSIAQGKFAFASGLDTTASLDYTATRGRDTRPLSLNDVDPEHFHTGSLVVGRHNTRHSMAGSGFTQSSKSQFVVGAGTNSNAKANLAEFTMEDILLNIDFLPTSNPNKIGQLYRDGGIMKISLG